MAHYVAVMRVTANVDLSVDLSDSFILFNLQFVLLIALQKAKISKISI